MYGQMPQRLAILCWIGQVFRHLMRPRTQEIPKDYKSFGSHCELPYGSTAQR